MLQGGTAKVLKENGVHAIQVNKIGQEAPTLLDLILEHKIDLVIDTPENGIERAKDGFLIRRYAIETGVPLPSQVLIQLTHLSQVLSMHLIIRNFQ